MERESEGDMREIRDYCREREMREGLEREKY